MLHQLLTRAQWLAGIALAGALCGCGNAEAIAIEQAPIVNGERSVPADDDVVQVTAHPAGSLSQGCSGTLVAPNIVLTALHCLAEFTGGDFSCNPDGTLSTNNLSGGTLGELPQPSEVEIRTGVYPGTAPDAYGVKLFGTGTNQICRNDLALIVLDRDLALPIASMRLVRGVELGELSRVLGYGASESTTTEGRFARAHVRIIDRGEDAGGSSTGSAAPRTVVVGQGPCHGDSGGPLISEETGAVVGVYSLVSGASCTAVGVRNVYTRLAPFADLVQSAFDFAAQTPTAEPLSEGGGGSAQAGEAATAGGGAAQAGAASASAGSAGSRPGGSGSSQDGNCSCRFSDSRASRSATLGALVTLGMLLARGRRRRARQ